MAILGNTQSVHLFDEQNGLIGTHTCKFHEVFTCIHFYHHFKQKQNFPIGEDYNHCKLVLCCHVFFSWNRELVNSSHASSPHFAMV